MSNVKIRNSSLAARSEIDLFSLPHTQVGIQNTRLLEIPLRNALTNEGPWDLVISSNPQFLQLSKNYLLIECRIVNENGEPIKAKVMDAANVEQDATWTGPIQLFGKTFIQKVQVAINGNQIYDSGPNYAYRCFLETELTNGYDSKMTHLKACGYESMAENIDRNDNEGFRNRAEPFRSGKYVQMMGKLHCDLFVQDRLLLPHTELHLTIYPNSNNFNLLNYDSGNYKIDFRSIKFYVRSVELLKSYCLSLERNLLRSPAKYPIKRVQVTNLHVTESRRNLPENNIFGGIIPRKVIIGCVESTAYRGNIKKSPFNFQNFGLSNIYIEAGGERFPNNPLTPDYANDLYLRAYLQTMDALGYTDTERTNCITPKQFKDGWCIYCFDLSPTQDSEDQNWNLERKGSTTICMDFQNQIPDGGIEVIVWAEFDSLLSIDNGRNCFLDYIS